MDMKFIQKYQVVLFIAVMLGLLVLGNQGETKAEVGNPVVKWQRIEGNGQPTRTITGVKSPGLPWSTTQGQVQLNVQTGQLTFSVQGLVLAGHFNLAVIGVRSPAFPQVKGTIVCNSTDPAPFNNVVLVDSEAVPLSEQGNAHFQGQIELPSVCDDMVFLIRNATPNVFYDFWIAYGAVRSP